MSKRQLIIDAAIELFAEKGYESTSIQEITSHCGISKGAFYLDFKSKDELILAIADYIIGRFGSKVDQVVNSSVDSQHKLFLYYSSMFESINSHRSFALIFINEQIHQTGQLRKVNHELFRKFTFYDEQFSYSILSLLESIYGDTISTTKYDLVVSMKGLVKSFCEYVLMQRSPVDIVALSQSLVDKTNILAKHSHSVFLTSEESLRRHDLEHVTLDYVIEQLSHAEKFASCDLEKESLHLLKNELTSEQPSSAIIQGMLHNLNQYTNSHYIVTLLKRYEHQRNM